MTTPSFQPPLGRRAQSRRLDYRSPEPVAVLDRSISRTDPDPHRQPRTIDDHRERYHWRDLAPQILRQRLVVEGTCAEPIDALQIRQYLNRLATVCDMRTLTRPVTHRSQRYGWAGWVHWETSGAHFYAWDQPVRFFSVDIYTCKAFDPDRVIDFTAQYFDTDNIVGRSF
ncbi:MAG: S-adenosylmethionine decarboxylase [Acidimicrobiia bacterium]